MSAVEYEAFRAKAARLLGDAGRIELIDYLASNPRAGKEYEGTGGVRHLRWPLATTTKKELEIGYYYSDGSTPVLLVALTRAKEGNLLSKVIRGLAAGA